MSTHRTMTLCLTLTTLATACGDLAVLPPQNATSLDATRGLDPNNPNDSAWNRVSGFALIDKQLFLANGLGGLDGNVVYPPEGMQFAGVLYAVTRSGDKLGQCFSPVAAGMTLVLGDGTSAYDVRSSDDLRTGLQPTSTCLGGGTLQVPAYFVVPASVTMADMEAGWVESTVGLIKNGVTTLCTDTQTDPAQGMNTTYCTVKGHTDDGR